MVTLNAHFDGKVIVPDDLSSLPLRAGARLKVNVEVMPDVSLPSTPCRFEPLKIRIDPELSRSIASDPEFNIEES